MVWPAFYLVIHWRTLARQIRVRPLHGSARMRQTQHVLLDSARAQRAYDIETWLNGDCTKEIVVADGSP